jgi:predicted nucleic acid-binding protein
MIILDTNVFSALMRSQPEAPVEEWLNRQSASSIWTTAITIFEIRFGLEVLVAGQKRSELQIDFQRVVEAMIGERIVPFDAIAADETAALMARRRREGRPAELRDSMIAGIAIAHRATLATRNTRHFADLPVPVVDPWGA